MVCRLFGANPLSETMLTYCQLGYNEHISMKLWNLAVYIFENTLENICKIETIFSWTQCVNEKKSNSQMETSKPFITEACIKEYVTQIWMVVGR